MLIIHHLLGLPDKSDLQLMVSLRVKCLYNVTCVKYSLQPLLMSYIRLEMVVSGTVQDTICQSFQLSLPFTDGNPNQ